jgi:hypothetical protein
LAIVCLREGLSKKDIIRCLKDDTELTGPAAASLTVSSTTTEADLFLTLRVQDPAGNDVTFPAAMDPTAASGLAGSARRCARPTPDAASRTVHGTPSTSTSLFNQASRSTSTWRSGPSQ